MAKEKTKAEGLGNMKDIEDKIRKAAQRVTGLQTRRDGISAEINSEIAQLKTVGISPKSFRRNLAMYQLDEEKKQAELVSDRAMRRALGLTPTLLDVMEGGGEDAEEDEEVDPSDKNPRSDPASGGAGSIMTTEDVDAANQQTGTTADGDQMIKDVAAKKAAEQAEGDAVLNASLPATKKSQSETAKAKREAAGLH